MFISSESDEGRKQTHHIDINEGLPSRSSYRFDETDGDEDPDVALAEGILEEVSEMKPRRFRR